MLRDMDADGKVGLKTAADARAWKKPGHGRAATPAPWSTFLEFCPADRDATLPDVLNDTKPVLA